MSLPSPSHRAFTLKTKGLSPFSDMLFDGLRCSLSRAIDRRRKFNLGMKRLLQLSPSCDLLFDSFSVESK